MSEITVETLLDQIDTLPVAEKKRLVSRLLDRLNGEHRSAPDFEYLKPIPEPDPEPNYRWMEATRARIWRAMGGAGRRSFDCPRDGRGYRIRGG